MTGSLPTSKQMIVQEAAYMYIHDGKADNLYLQL